MVFKVFWCGTLPHLGLECLGLFHSVVGPHGPRAMSSNVSQNSAASRQHHVDPHHAGELPLLRHHPVLCAVAQEVVEQVEVHPTVQRSTAPPANCNCGAKTVPVMALTQYPPQVDARPSAGPLRVANPLKESWQLGAHAPQPSSVTPSCSVTQCSRPVIHQQPG